MTVSGSLPSPSASVTWLSPGPSSSSPSGAGASGVPSLAADGSVVSSPLCSVVRPLSSDSSIASRAATVASPPSWGMGLASLMLISSLALLRALP